MPNAAIRWGRFGVALLMLGCGRTALTEPAAAPAPSVDAGSLGEPDAGLGCAIALTESTLARVSLTADNQRALWVNGELVEETSNEWYQATSHAVPLWRHPSRENVIAVRATNLTTQGGFDRGLLLSLTLNESTVVSDRGWRQRGISDGGWPSVDLSWTLPGFDDDAWGFSVEQAGNGAPPWGFVGVVSRDAQWIWPYLSSTNLKPDVEPVLFRRSVYVTLDGGLAFTPAPCP